MPNGSRHCSLFAKGDTEIVWMIMEVDERVTGDETEGQISRNRYGFSLELYLTEV